MLKRKFFKNALSFVFGAVFCGLFLFAGIYLGYDIGFDSGAAAQRQEYLSQLDEGGGVQDVDFGIFWQAWDMLKSFHVDGEKFSNQDFLYGAINGLAGTLGDPNTTFFPPADAKKFEEDISGSFGGIGAEIGIEDNILTVTAPIKDSPADKAGLRSRDKILEIDGESTAGINLDEAVKKIRGPIGTSVVLTVLNEDLSDPKKVEIVRQEIVIPTLDYSMLDGEVGYIQLYSFHENAGEDFFEAGASLLLKGAKAIILDLRDNPGGFLEISTYITGWFVERGEVIVSERFKSGEDRVFRARGNEALKNLPVVVLINGGSASASEILAGSLRDIRGVKLVGEKSFGKGTVQEVTGLSDGSSLKITVAHWVLPSGQILSEGLAPDIEVPLTEEDIKAGRDPQLLKALEVIRQEISSRVVLGRGF